MRYLFRADATPRMGTGHIMRCLALAQAMIDRDAIVSFACSQIPETLATRLENDRITILKLAVEPGSKEDAVQTAKLFESTGASCLILDGYQFSGDFQKRLREAGSQVLVIDDNCDTDHYWAELVLNQNFHANEAMYSQRERHTRLLLGTQYVLMRREFRRWCDWQREVPSLARKVLVTLGGSDPDNATAKVLDVLRITPIDNLEAVVLVGASNPRFDELTQLAAAIPDRQIRLIRDAGDMPSLMAWADLAIGAGGTTTWEFLFFGLSPLLIVLADNQIDIAESLHRDRLAYDMGWHHSLDTVKMASELARISADYAERSERAIRARQLVDGRGAERVVAILAGE